MSILIKDISMPKYGELNITIDALGGVAYTDKDMKEHEVIEVPTPHGKWIKGVCNKCGFDWGKVAPIAGVPKYCPNCGVKMERREDG